MIFEQMYVITSYSIHYTKLYEEERVSRCPRLLVWMNAPDAPGQFLGEYPLSRAMSHECGEDPENGCEENP